MTIISFFKHLIFIIFLCIIQIFLFNQIYILSYINYHIYTLFVFTYPSNENKFMLILLSFLTGLTIDYFLNTDGMSAFCLTLISYLRQDILRFVAGNNILTEAEYDVSIYELFFIKKLFFIFLLTTIYYFAYFLFEYIKISNIENIVIKNINGIIFTTIFSLIYILVTEKKNLL